MSEKIVSLPGNAEVTDKDKTHQMLIDRLTKMMEVMGERRFTSIAIVAVDTLGRPTTSFAVDENRYVELVGGLEYLKWRVAKDLDDEMDQMPLEPKGSA